jgi:aminopeptidase
MKFTDLGTYYIDLAQKISSFATAPSLWKTDIDAFISQSSADMSTDDLLQLVNHAQDLEKIFIAGLENNQNFYDEVHKMKRLQWRDYTAPPAAIDLQYSLAEKLYNADASKGDVAIITLSNGARHIGVWLLERAVSDRLNFSIDFTEPDFSALLFNHTDMAGVTRLANHFLEKTKRVNKRIVAASGQPTLSQFEADEDKKRAYAHATSSFGERVRSGDVFFTLTVIPTEKDAEIDGIDYQEYTKLFFEMCDQPWDAISLAQQQLILELNAGKHLRFTNNDGTDIEMNIDGFTFCNSLIAKNVPGSEVFSAPHRDSVNGIIVAKGRFSPPHDKGEVIENLTLEFKNGRLVSYRAEKGLEAFENEINLDEGARWIGEVGIGTNPYLKTHVANGLLVEKIGGSFHLALGACYTMKEYQGVPVNVDNGNQSTVHWDVTTMLHGKEGRIYIDGRMIMDDGKFIDAKYDVLNRGWAAIERNDRPDYWRDRKDTSFSPKSPAP